MGPHPTGSGSCSAIVKLLPGNKDMLVAHDTWTAYANMLRIYKQYDLKYSISLNDSKLRTRTTGMVVALFQDIVACITKAYYWE